MSVILTADGQVDISDIVAFDPQVEAELDPLNNATNRIKTLEIELDRARSDFRCLLSETSSKVNSLCKKLGSCAEKSKLCRNSRIHAKKWLTETKNTSHLEDQRVLSAHNESEKAVHQLHQELKKSIVKSCLSTRRSLLQINNLANQHQLQLLPYFEMKAQFNQMFEEQIKKVPPLEYNDSKIKMTDVDTQFHLEKSSEELLQHWKFQDMLDNRENNNIRSKASISMASSYQDSLSSENVYLEHLFSEDLFMDLPSNLKLTPGLVNCSVSHSSNSCFKSSRHHSFEIGSSIENLSSEICHGNPSYNSMLYKSNGFQHCKEVLKQSSNGIIDNDEAKEMFVNRDVIALKTTDPESSAFNGSKLNVEFSVLNAKISDDDISDSVSVTNSDQSNILDYDQI